MTLDENDLKAIAQIITQGKKAESWRDIEVWAKTGDIEEHIIKPLIGAEKAPGLADNVHSLFYDQFNYQLTMGESVPTGAGIVRRPAFQDALSPFYLSGGILAFIEGLIGGGKEKAEAYAKNIREETFKLLAPQIQANYFSRQEQRNDAHENPRGAEHAVYAVGAEEEFNNETLDLLLADYMQRRLEH